MAGRSCQPTWPLSQLLACGMSCIVVRCRAMSCCLRSFSGVVKLLLQHGADASRCDKAITATFWQQLKEITAIASDRMACQFWALQPLVDAMRPFDLPVHAICSNSSGR